MKLLGILLFLLVGCGESPFLNDEGELRSVQAVESELYLKDSEVSINTFWQEGPYVFDESKILIILQGSNGTTYKEEISFKVKIWMPGMGHGSFPVTLEKIADGVFLASEVFFTMPGYWDIHFQVFDGEALKEEVKWGLEL